MSYSIQLASANMAEQLCRQITLDLPEYFGLPECNEQHARTHDAKTGSASLNDISLFSLNYI